MFVGTLLVKVHIPGAESLKEKRRVVNSVVRKVQHRFNVSIAEVNNENLWQRADLGVAIVGDDWGHIQRRLQLVINFLESEPRWNILQIEMERV